MHGFQNILHSKTIFWSVFLLLIAGCGGSKRVEKEKSSEELKEFLAKYEKTFDPSAYNPAVESIKVEEQNVHKAIEAANSVEVALPETIPGFRIQVLFTPEIEEAAKIRDSLNASVPEEWIYVVFDSPYYKVRLGNFIERYEAQALLRRLISLGFSEAWIVPDKIIKNPPPRTPELPEIQPH
jgi:SPOR domain